MDEEITIPFYNDLLFKYFISDNDDKESMYLLKTIIESVTPLRCQALYVMNSELIPSRYKEKKAILNVRVQTDEGEFVNIEVQSTGMFESLHKRFQYYVFKNIATQVHSGDDYRKIKPVYMIILFNDEDRKHHELVRIRSDCDEKYHDSDGSLYHIYYVFLKEIDRIIKEKGKENLNDLEELSYLIEKGSLCDRINMTEVGRIMKRKYDRFMEDMNLREEAWAYEKARWDELARYDDMKKELDAQLAEAKMKAAEAETKAKAEFVLKLFKSKYLNEDTQWLENLTEQQYDQIFKKLIEDASLEEIKKIIGD